MKQSRRRSCRGRGFGPDERYSKVLRRSSKNRIASHPIAQHRKGGEGEESACNEEGRVEARRETYILTCKILQYIDCNKPANQAVRGISKGFNAVDQRNEVNDS